MGKTRQTIASMPSVRIRRFRPADASGELLDRFIALRERSYADDFFFYSDGDLHRRLIEYYQRRSDYRFEMLLCEQQDGVDVARVIVGCARDLPWAFFGFAMYAVPNLRVNVRAARLASLDPHVEPDWNAISPALYGVMREYALRRQRFGRLLPPDRSIAQPLPRPGRLQLER